MKILQLTILLTVAAATTSTVLNLMQQNDEDSEALTGKRMRRGFFMGYPQRFSYGNRTRPTGTPEKNNYGPQYRPTTTSQILDSSYGYNPQNRPLPSQISNGNYDYDPQNRPSSSQVPNFGNYNGYGPKPQPPVGNYNSGFVYPEYEPQPPRRTPSPPARFQYGRPKPISV